MPGPLVPIACDPVHAQLLTPHEARLGCSVQVNKIILYNFELQDVASMGFPCIQQMVQRT